uniref:Uncharacterized protein n=1 Tax=Dermatophagoides pteronyssinus TaxID=6956 RepID=A0ABQ8IW06_DERPT|nr:hypothetical protein DERP_008696 [Dermatophagoides pteronyssinus]
MNFLTLYHYISAVCLDFIATKKSKSERSSQNANFLHFCRRCWGYSPNEFKGLIKGLNGKLFIE